MRINFPENVLMSIHYRPPQTTYDSHNHDSAFIVRYNKFYMKSFSVDWSYNYSNAGANQINTKLAMFFVNTFSATHEV